MKFLLSNNIKENKVLKEIIALFIFMAFLFLLGQIILEVTNLGISPTSITEYYKGSERKFLEPKSLTIILEELHIKIFLIGFLILILSNLILLTDLSLGVKNCLIVSSFAMGIFDSLSGFLIVYGSPFFSYFKIFAFLLLNLSLILMISFVLHYLFKNSPSPPFSKVGQGGFSDERE